MKKITPIVLLLSLLISCTKNDNHSPTIITQEINDYKFLKQKLKEFAIIFTPVLNNKDARNIVVNKVKQKFDQEYEVLIKDLFNDPQIQSLVAKSESDVLHKDLLTRSGENIYPQIYIPHFQYIEDNSIKTPNTISTIQQDSLIEDPIYVFYSGDPEVDSTSSRDIFPGYKLINNEFLYFTMVDEVYANEHQVWVFSLNESVNSNGILPCELQRNGAIQLNSPCGGGGGGTGGGGVDNDPDIGDEDPTDAPAARVDFPELGHNKISFKIEAMRVRNPKESWVSGASEISIRAKLVCHNGRREGIPGAEQKEYSSDQYSNYLGKLITKAKRKDIKQQNLLYVNYPMQTNWQNSVESIDPVHFVYIIFERDSWPAKKNLAKRYAPISPITNEQPPGSFNLYYRSSDNYDNYPYADFRFTNTLTLAAVNTWAGSGLVENTDIAFNTVLF